MSHLLHTTEYITRINFLASVPNKTVVSITAAFSKLKHHRWTELYSRVEKTNNLSGISYDRFVWAMEMVRSRAFTGEIYGYFAFYYIRRRALALTPTVFLCVLTF